MADNLKELGTDLMDQFRAGEESAFSRVFRLYHGPLTHFAFRILDDEQAAEDVVQESFIILWQRRSKLHNIISLNSYLYQVVRSTALQYQQKKKLETAEMPEQDISDTELYNEQIRAEIMAHIVWVMDHLPPRMKQVLKLHYLEDKSLDEIGQVTGTGYETIRSQRYTAIRFVRHILGTARSSFFGF